MLRCFCFPSAAKNRQTIVSKCARSAKLWGKINVWSSNWFQLLQSVWCCQFFLFVVWWLLVISSAAMLALLLRCQSLRQAELPFGCWNSIRSSQAHQQLVACPRCVWIHAEDNSVWTSWPRFDCFPILNPERLVKSCIQNNRSWYVEPWSCGCAGVLIHLAGFKRCMPRTFCTAT